MTALQNNSQHDVAIHTGRRLRFGVFELDLQDRELSKRGVRIKLQQKPFQILELLLQTPGEFVTRAQLARHLWPESHVSFNGSLNTAVNALRKALGDSPGNPRFIETRPGRGYRFIASVTGLGETSSAPSERHPSVKTRHDNFEAYQDYLKGRHFYNKMNEEDLRKSIAYFEAALGQDPQYAMAYTGLAEAYNLCAFLGTVPASEARARSQEFTAKALSVDDDLACAHASLASARYLYEWDWQGAEEEYLKALDLDPRFAGGHLRYAALLSAAGRPEDAMLQMRLAQELDPLSPVIDMEMAWNLYMARDFNGAEERSWKALAVEPRFAAAQHTLGLAYEQMDMLEEALVELQNARTCSGDHPATVAALGHALAKAGRRSEASELLRELQQVSQRRTVSPYWHAVLHCGLGEDHLAFDSLAKAYQERDVWLIWLKVEPRFDCLRSNPRFQEFVRGIDFRPLSA